MRHRLATACTLAALALTAGACGDESPAPGPGGDDAAAQADEVSHIHGVGINPADGALIIATHSGLFRAARDEEVARRIGDLRQDTMGFTIVGPDRFLGSGHPDLRQDLPPLLGLIRSADAGRTWEPVSLLGQADFHVLRAAGRRIYGVNAADGRLLVSSDGGREWAPRTPPEPLLDLAIDPADPDRVVASGERALFVSRDAGRSWRPASVRHAGLLAWTGDHLVLVDGAGTAHASRDGGRTFERAGDAGGRPAALASHGEQLLVALHDNTVRQSADGGRNWSLRARGGA